VLTYCEEGAILEAKESTVATYPDLFEKCYNFLAPDQVRAMGIYPYFHPIQSPPGDEVIVDGKLCIMVGSNNYLGLVNHPKVKEAAARSPPGAGATAGQIREARGGPLFLNRFSDQYGHHLLSGGKK
jgi:hypothetical protein